MPERHREGKVVSRIIGLLHGIFSFGVFQAVFLYMIAFVADICVVPKTIDPDPSSRVVVAVIVDLALLRLFAVQHSATAWPVFKQWWMRRIPKSAERSTAVLAASLCLALLRWQWQPLPGVVWVRGNDCTYGCGGIER